MADERKRRRVRASGFIACAAVLAACSTPSKSTQGSRTTTTKAQSASTTTTTSLPVTPVQWSGCGSDLQCGSVVVPLDYANPSGPTIAIALERHLALVPSARIGSLVINPGGPGVSGINDFSNELDSLTGGLLDDFDLVTFDPRGVGKSDPVTCGETAGGPPGQRPDQVPQTAAAQQSFLDDVKAFAQACEKASGTLLPYVGTVDVARDLDRIRQAIGDTDLTYMGQSYGTLLGITYAQLFPTHIRAMVLDGVIDPSVSLNDMDLLQAEGFENSLNQFFSWCSAQGCAWHPAGDPTAALLALIEEIRQKPLPTGTSRTLGPGEVYDALLQGMYATSYWSTLASGLAEAAAGNGAGLLAMSDRYNSASDPNVDDANLAIDCLDHPVSRDLSSYRALAATDAQAAPVFGPLLAWGEAGCAVWPAEPTRTPGPVSAAGSPAILVVGTTNDPATRYAWAQSVARTLAHGALLTVDGDNHVAYFYSSCVRSDIQSYLVSLAVPAPGATC